ncbi:MAG: DNA invertase Pin-like site-specific DNA recombinase [Clostridium sp.]|jgi:DNA invertase Pin-like site-specific DNA recombinase
MKKAYSYIRYSSPQQAKGDSYRRQYAKTKKYCTENGYELDKKLSVYKELGVSGVDGDQENLRLFISDCESGKVEKGSLLVVENLDRLSRKAINKAMSQFLNLLDYVDIYSTQDKTLYSSNDEVAPNIQLMNIITSLLIMSRAHEESATKKIRLKESWDNKRNEIHKQKISSSYPHWLILSEDWKSFSLKEKESQSIRKIFELCIGGMGYSQIIRFLNGDLIKYPTPSNRSKLWVRSTVTLLLSDRRVLGEMQLYTGAYRKREKYGKPIKDYYPQVIDKKLFLKAQLSLESRSIGAGKTGKYSFSNIFRGFLLCVHCESKMEYVDKGNTKKRSQKYLTCTNSKRGGSCTHTRHYRYEELEKIFLHLATENGFMPKPVEPNNLNLQLKDIKGKNKIANDKLELLLDKDFTISAILKKVEELNNDIKLYERDIKDLERRLLSLESDYEYDQLYHDVVTEKDDITKFNNRAKFNSYISKDIVKAYLFENYCPMIIFEMKDGITHSIIVDKKYNFGGCSLPNGKDTYKRINGEESQVDEMIWNIQKQFYELIDSTKNIGNIDNNLDDIYNRINKTISKIIIEQDVKLFDQFIQLIQDADEIINTHKTELF